MTSAPPQLRTSPSHQARIKNRPLIFGEVLFDHFPDGRKVLGGAPFNVTWHLEAFGCDPRLVSAVGDDADGREILGQMESWGLDTTGVQVCNDHPTGHVQVTDSQGEPSFEIPPNQAWDQVEEAAAMTDVALGSVAILYHGTLALRNNQSWQALRSLKGATGAPTFVDLNLRDPWWSEDRVEWCLSTASWLKLNETELSTLTGSSIESSDECEQAAVRLAREHGIQRLIVTLGAKGAFVVRDGSSTLRVEAVEVPDLVDTVGAGDAFSAVFCLGILKGWGDRTILDRANRFAADICTIQGATSGDLTLYDRHIREWTEEPGRAGGLRGEGAPGLYIMSLSVHGLVRGTGIELGRDADTGGQVSYVVDQATALAARPDVEAVELVTRAVVDQKVDKVYSEPVEVLSDGARIVRIPFGPKRYLRKESLWPHLDSLLDQIIRYVRAGGRAPDLIHGHYADAGHVGAQLSKLLGVPFLFTGHSLGRVKRARLLERGDSEQVDEQALEQRYHFERRIEAEETALETAALVIASTHQEVHEQYELYDHYQPDRMQVIPPGVDVSRFSPPPLGWRRPPVASRVNRFLRAPEKPMILALARADERKNFPGLIKAYAETPGLRAKANLVLIVGNREDIGEMPAGARRVLTEILLLIDRYDLYGSVAYPKQHSPDDVPDLFRLAAKSRGVFVNPALTEPFGLTLLEAAASGLPVVATDDGGPRDILAICENGTLVDPLDSSTMGLMIRGALASRKRWGHWSKNGITGVHKGFSWTSHARRYVREVERVLEGVRPAPAPARRSRILGVDRLLITDIDDTLIGNDEALEALVERLKNAGDHIGFGIATGRTIGRALQIFEQLGIPTPDVLITSSGAQIHYGPDLIRDRSWERQIGYRWDPEGLEEFLSIIPGLDPAEVDGETSFRLRYVVDPNHAPTPEELQRALRKLGFHVTTILDHAVHLDILPVRASPGLAIRFFCFKWDLPPERLLVVGDSGNDSDMLSGDTLGVVVSNHTPELESLRGTSRIHFAAGDHAWGILEGIEWYDFFDNIRIPEDVPEDEQREAESSEEIA